MGNHFWNVIQNWEEKEQGLNNLFVIQEENTPPGYCMLQLPMDIQLHITEVYGDNALIYRGDKVLLKNTIFKNIYNFFGRVSNGPAGTDKTKGYCDQDYVIAFPFKTFPECLKTWLQQQTEKGHLSQDMKKYIESKPCYVVPAGRKDSPSQDAEWRISTSHAERCLMFNWNVTQLQCYILFKYVLKTYLKHPEEQGLSSFICKNLLLMCINKTHPCVWCPYNLLKIFTYCLLQLKRSISREYCPHFIIRDNNLMARKFTPEIKHWLLEKIQLLYESHGRAFFGIKMDNLGNLLKSRLNTPSYCIVVTDSPHQAGNISGSLFYDLALLLSGRHIFLLQIITENNSFNASRLLTPSFDGMATTLQLQQLIQLMIHGGNFVQAKSFIRTYSIMATLLQLMDHGDDLELAASRLLTPLICSSLGSIIASRDIRQDHSVSPEALTWLALGLNSDVASSRLKLASVYYCVGDFNKTEDMLNNIADVYDERIIAAACSCNNRTGERFLSEKFKNYANTHNELAVRHIVALCVNFITDELHCQPRELQYEMFRTTRKDRAHRDERYDYWMDWAVVDSLPYLYFLLYKTFGHLQRFDRQQQALDNLARSIHTTKNLKHKETALNLLGQCYQQENRHTKALQCYVNSLNVRPTNNAAKLHICRLLYAVYTLKN